MTRRQRSSGSTVLEFTLAGIPIMLVFISVAQMSLTMWSFQSLAYTAKELNRYIAVHGTHCSSGTNSCSLTVGNVATAAENYALGLSTSTLHLQLISPSTSYDCNPVTNCTSNSNAWPPSTDSTVGTWVEVRLKYPVSPVFTMIWPGSRPVDNQGYTLQAYSKQRVLF